MCCVRGKCAGYVLQCVGGVYVEGNVYGVCVTVLRMCVGIGMGVSAPSPDSVW